MWAYSLVQTGRDLRPGGSLSVNGVYVGAPVPASIFWPPPAMFWNWVIASRKLPRARSPKALSTKRASRAGSLRTTLTTSRAATDCSGPRARVRYFTSAHVSLVISSTGMTRVAHVSGSITWISSACAGVPASASEATRAVSDSTLKKGMRDMWISTKLVLSAAMVSCQHPTARSGPPARPGP